VETGERHLGLDHPELGQMAARLRLLGAEGRPEDVDLAEGHRARLAVELAALREVRGLVEVADRKERGRTLAGGGSQDGRVEGEEAASVEVLATGADYLRAHAQDGVLPGGAQPEVAVIEQEGRAVLLRRDGVLGGLLDDTEIGHA